jgi:hypothetical protein
MNIEQVVETLAQAMNVGHGGVGMQSAQDRPMCRFSQKSHADLMSSTDQKNLCMLSLTLMSHLPSCCQESELL